MNRRAAIITTILSAFGVQAAAADGDTTWIDIATGQPIPGMGAPTQEFEQIFEDLRIPVLIVAPAGGGVIIGVRAIDYVEWRKRVSQEYLSGPNTRTEQNQAIDNSITDNSIHDSFNKTLINDLSRTGSTVSVTNCATMPGR